MSIDHILKLARIEIGKKEKKDLKKEFSLILNFVNKLKEVDIRNVKPMAYPINLKNVMREDTLPPALPKKEKMGEKLLKLAPKIKNQYIKVKEVL